MSIHCYTILSCAGKFVLAKEKGIHLINIFDYAWIDEQEKIKSYLHDLLGETAKIYARKCRWARIEKAEACGFADMYHLQGSTRLQEINYGLYYIDELIAVMSFGKPRYKQSSDIFELQRYCVKFFRSYVESGEHPRPICRWRARKQAEK